MHALPLVVLLALAWPTALAAQTVYKCTEAGGTLVYSDRPCSTDPGNVETIDTSESMKTSSGGSIAEQGEYARTNQLRRTCDERAAAIRGRYAREYARIDRQIADLESRIRKIDPRLVGSTFATELRSQLPGLTTERDRLKAAEAQELATANERCRKELELDEKRRASAEATRANARRAEEQAARSRAAEEKRRADAAAKLDKDGARDRQ